MVKKKEEVSEETIEERAEETPQEAPKEAPKERTYGESEVTNLIQQALRQFKESSQKEDVVKTNAPMKHFRPIRRWRTKDGQWKWVVDLKNFNTDDLDERPQHSFEKFNDQAKQMESFIGLIFNDKTEEIVKVNQYVDKRDQKYCKLISTEEIDSGYSTGIVDERIDGKKTGRKIEQRVNIVTKKYRVELPDGSEVVVPDYAIA